MSAGKGDTRRPVQVDRRTYEDNWARTFGGSQVSQSDNNPSTTTEAT